MRTGGDESCRENNNRRSYNPPRGAVGHPFKAIFMSHPGAQVGLHAC